MDINDPRHGTRNGYDHLKCRCVACKDAKSASSKKARDARSLPPGDPRHGTYNGHANYHCRCTDCITATSAYRKELRDRRRDANGDCKMRLSGPRTPEELARLRLKARYQQLNGAFFPFLLLQALNIADLWDHYANEDANLWRRAEFLKENPSRDAFIAASLKRRYPEHSIPSSGYEEDYKDALIARSTSDMINRYI